MLGMITAEYSKKGKISKNTLLSMAIAHAALFKIRQIHNDDESYYSECWNVFNGFLSLYGDNYRLINEIDNSSFTNPDCNSFYMTISVVIALIPIAYIISDENDLINILDYLAVKIDKKVVSAILLFSKAAKLLNREHDSKRFWETLPGSSGFNCSNASSINRSFEFFNSDIDGIMALAIHCVVNAHSYEEAISLADSCTCNSVIIPIVGQIASCIWQIEDRKKIDALLFIETEAPLLSGIITEFNKYNHLKEHIVIENHALLVKNDTKKIMPNSNNQQHKPNAIIEFFKSILFGK